MADEPRAEDPRGQRNGAPSGLKTTGRAENLLFLNEDDKDQTEELLWAMEKWKSKTRIPTFPQPRQPAAQGRTAVYTKRLTRPQHLLKWMTSAMRSKLEPFKKFVGMLRSHLDGVLAWTQTRLSNGAVEGMNNKIKSISHRSFGFRSAETFIAAIYHCCGRLPLPVEC